MSEYQDEDVEIRWGITIPTRDGVRLSGTLYLPPEQRVPGPAILALTPYIAQTYHDRGVYFARNGYPFLIADVRGRGNSEGEFRPFAHEGDDAYDAIEWLALQRYCSGQVAMWGGSYGGYAQWSAAKAAPPHLCTIVPVASPYIGVDFPIRSNIGSAYWMQWLTLVSGRASQDKMFWNNQRYWGGRFRRWFESGVAFKQLDTYLGNPSSIFQEWTSHPERDDYWDGYNPSPDQYAEITMPTLTITGVYDGDQLGALAHYREHLRSATSAGKNNHYLIIGPWDHAGTRVPATEFCGLTVGRQSLIDLPRLHCQWYAWTMQGGPKPDFLRKRVAYYVMGADEWRYADSLDDVTVNSVPLYLHSICNPQDVFGSGSLSEDIATHSHRDHYVYDPRDVSLAKLESTVDPESRTDHRMVYAAIGKQLIYHTAPYRGDVEISGFFKLSLWISIDQPDTDFRVSVYEVEIDGSAIQLTSDSMRARYREDARTPRLIGTNEPLRYDFTGFMFVSRRLMAGSRLRLVVGPINSIYSQKNHNSGGEVAAESMEASHVVTVCVFHDEEHPSALHVPLGAY